MTISKTKRVALCGIFGLFTALSAQAATSGTIILSGTQPGILEITVSTAPTAMALLISTDVVDQEIGTVTERSNQRAGYTVTLTSASAAASASANPSFTSLETTDVLPYVISYGGSPVTFVAGAPAVVSDMSAKTSGLGIVNIVTVSFDGESAFLDEAVYGDTLTFTIIAK